MKNLLLIFLGWVCTTGIFAQTHTLRANLDANRTVEMTVRIENQIAYVSRQAVPFDASAKHGIHDLAGAEFGEGTIALPNDGGSYWAVPFDGEIQEINRPLLCFNCICIDKNECDVVGRTCYIGSCYSCLLALFPCNMTPNQGQILIQGPFTLIKAGSIVLE